MPIAGVCAVQLVGVVDTSQQWWSNTFHIGSPVTASPPSLAQLTQLGLDLKSWFQSSYQSVLSTASTLDHIQTRQVSVDSKVDPVMEVTTSVLAQGTRTLTSPPGPKEACAVLQFRTAFASRRFRGHLFLPPALNASDMSYENWDGTKPYHVACGALNTKFAAGAGTTPTWTGTELSLWHLAVFSHAAAAQGGTSWQIVSTTALPPRVHWLRSRARGTL